MLIQVLGLVVPETTVPFKLLKPAIMDFTIHCSWIIGIMAALDKTIFFSKPCPPVEMKLVSVEDYIFGLPYYKQHVIGLS